ncbi:phospholipase D-like domain-containing protein [Pajaroellobacter abortibovis]|uniref:PLD phosphodiesterase domain-containing protein n=1 Tax=Pajaroellobacter abortibovis TaxID=1882918 RepID=A0A1L6MXI9_9BACT|nr:phospholipase D-like domain-containing protein [Pajaroellobacter abortibovis]APS00199.1 hypothetical protein BCY86_05520 [Pajaroellobacter abortibovis]
MKIDCPTLHTVPWFSVGEDRLRLLRNGEQAFPAMLESIENAQKEILMEFYWIGADPIGAMFRDALTRRAKVGVCVRVIYDAIGSLTTPYLWWQPLLQTGGEVSVYHALWPFDPTFKLSLLERRDHRKLLLVDGQDGFIGGINLALSWLPIHLGGKGWRDDLVHIQGATSQQIRAHFYLTWQSLTRSLPPVDVHRISRKNDSPVYILTDYLHHRQKIHREYLARMSAAKRSIDIANPYFVPNRLIRMGLFRAVARKVRVRVLLPANGDVSFVQFATEALIDSLLKHGIELYTLAKPMIHTKIVIIDNEFTMLGSYNLDERSRHKNLEMNLAIQDTAFADYATQGFEQDICSATKLDLYTWRQRPFLNRTIEWVAWGLRKLW